MAQKKTLTKEIRTNTFSTDPTLAKSDEQGVIEPGQDKILSEEDVTEIITGFINSPSFRVKRNQTPTSDSHVATKAYVDDQVATADTFIEHADTPASFVGGAGNILRVNAGSDAVEFATIGTIADSRYVNIDGDTMTGDLKIDNFKELRFYDDGANYVGFEAPALTANQIWVLPAVDGAAGDIIDTDGSGNLNFKTPTVDIPLNLTMYDAEPARASETNWNGGILKLDDAASLSSGVPFVMSAKMPGKFIIVINAGSDMVGDITATGTSVDRNTKAQTASDTSVMTLTGVSTDGTTTDANGNTVHSYTKAYITDKWFTGVVTLTTADVTITDMDIYHVSFEQFNDSPGITLDSFDANIFATNANAEFDAYLYGLEVTGDECDIAACAELHAGAVGGAAAVTVVANEYARLRQGNLAKALDGTTDGIWADVHYSNSPAYIEDVTLKIWATKSQALTLT